MPKKAVTKKASGTSQKVGTPPADPLEMSSDTKSTPAKAAKSKSKKVKSTEPVVEDKAPAQVVETTNTVSSAEETTNTVEAPSGQELVSSVLNEFSTTLQTLTTQLATLRTEFKNLSKTVNREMKTASKSSKKKRTGGNKQPSGFVKPTLITDELATFLGRDKGTEMARTEVTKEINQYIRDHKLQDSSNGRHINPDDKLTKLLSYDGSETLTYFNLQKYLSPHFVKAEQPSA
jgi:upstream activation factor subunit UAF30